MLRCVRLAVARHAATRRGRVCFHHLASYESHRCFVTATALRLGSITRTHLLSDSSRSNNTNNSNQHSGSAMTSSNSSTVGGRGLSQSAADEDSEDLERERNLRAQFTQKIQQHSAAQSNNEACASTGAADGQGGSAARAPFVAAASGPGQVFRFFFFVTAIFALLALLPYADRRNPVHLMRGIPWWQLPIASASYFLLLRTLYPRAEENRIKMEYESETRHNPGLTFDEFMNGRYATMFQGYRTSQAEMVAAVAACLSAAKDVQFARIMTRAVGRNKDTKDSVDNMMDALRREFPSLF